MSKDDRVQVAPDCFIHDSAGIFSDRKKEEKPQPKLPAVPEPLPTNYVPSGEVMEVAVDTSEKRVSLVELCKQIATTTEYISELSTATDLIRADKAGCVMVVIKGDGISTSSVVSEIPVNKDAALAGLTAETNKANQTLKHLLSKIEAKDHA